MTQMTFTKPQLADAVVQLFDILRQGKKGWPIFETLYGGQFDIMAYRLSDYVEVTGSQKYPFYSSYHKLNMGNGFELNVALVECDQWDKKNKKAEYFLRWYLNYDNEFCHGDRLYLESNGYRVTSNTTYFPNTLVVESMLADKFWDDIFKAIKRRAAITLREYKKYLRRPAFYDTLEKELNIKLRIKK